jgi:probable rRNA maturation factor
MPDGDAGPRLRVVCTDVMGRRIHAGGLARWLARFAPARARGTVNVAIVSDATMRRLNREYRGRNRATDVLSFATESGRSRRAGGSRKCLGDIVIARGVAAAQARRQGHPLATEFRVLALHGLLHLLGYDHESDDGRMRRAEARLRARGGLPVGLIERGRARAAT